MNEAAKLLVKKALEIEEQATAIYESTIRRATEEKDSEACRVKGLRLSAREVCDHSEELRKNKTRRCGTHGRDEEDYVVIYCGVCGVHLRNE